MSTESFSPGQRWISETEINLGLGIVVETVGRQVVFSFPAAGERRNYAIDNAPVSRVKYGVGDEVSSVDEWSMRVTQVLTKQDCLIYWGIDNEGCERELHEFELNAFVQFSTPEARLFAGQIDSISRFELRCETLEQIRRHQQSPVNGLLGARVQLLPHQLYIAHETAQRFAPRVLLADEVGLGKTIEAGLIVHQQLVSGRASRVLILVPENLVHQWLVEMLRRFNLHFTILDRDRCAAIADGDNPFETAQLVLCPLSLLVEDQSLQQQAHSCDWDLLLVDEAHHLEWSEQQASPAYLCVEELARISKGLLLLTATPEQLGLDSHFARLRLLDPDRYHSLERFREEESGYLTINTLVQELLSWLATHPDAVATDLQPDSLQELLTRLEQYLGEQAVSPLKKRLREADSEEPLSQFIDPLVSALLDRHGTGRVLFRNTRDNVQGFPQRQLIPFPLPIPEMIGNADAKALGIDELLYPEIILGDNWVEQDTRVSWLSRWLTDHRDTKTLIICARTDTAIALEEHLRKYTGAQTAVFHEGMDLVARDRAAAYFADVEEGAQLLVCSEIGSEGRNFQFAHHLVLFDLPLNPDLLEQRIGRLDRIGQRKPVKILVPYYEEGVQALLLRWYHQGIDAFEQASAVGQTIYQVQRQQLLDCLLQGADSDRLLRETVQMRERLQREMREGRDRLLELNSCHPDRARRLVAAIAEQERGAELFDYMSQVFEQFGVEQEHHSVDTLVLHPGDHMHCSRFPGLPEGGVTVTHNRQLALAREDIQFLTWEHPMVTGAMDMVLNEDFGNTAVCTLKLGPLQPGTLLLEAVFTMHCPAPAALELSRYLPMTAVRILLDDKDKELSGVLTRERLGERVQRVNKTTARELVKHAQPRLDQMLAEARRKTGPEQRTIVQQALDRMRQAQHAELERLQALAEVNPNIRRQEIELLQAETDALEHFLQRAQLKLDAIRVIVAV